MNPTPLNRRSFLKSTVAGALTVAAATTLPQVGVAAPASTPPPAPLPPPAPVPGTLTRADLSRCLPAVRLTRDFTSNCWNLVDYETEDGVKGVMAAAYPGQDCGELTLPLEATGTYRILLGINYTKATWGFDSPYGQVEVKLSDDPGFRRVAAEGGINGEDGKLKIGVNQDCYRAIQEVYWKTAELSGQSLVFRQPEAPYNREEHACISNISYVKLVPLSAAERDAWRQTLPTAATKRIGMIFCTGQFTGHTSGTYTFHPTKASFFDNEFTPYVNSDIGLVIFEAMRGNYCLFKTKLGDVGPDDNQWRDDWVDPLAEMIRVARRHGVKIFASQRMIGAQFPLNRTPISRARFYWQHPEWVKLDRDGVRLTGLSLAYAGVRQHWLGLLREALAYGIDGIQLHLNRATPFIGYEPPVVEAFQARHGVDPRQLPEEDPRWAAHCAGYVTAFLREVRALVDERPGRELAITLYGEPTKYDHDKKNYHPLRYQCDVETWITERIADYLMPSPYISLDLIRQWRKLGGERLHIWPDLMPRTQLPSDYARLARRYYEAGADGLCTWDGERRAARLSEWAAVQRLGHRDQLDRLEQEAKHYYRRVPCKYLGGFSARDAFHDG
jgi:hypothetical protein